MLQVLRKDLAQCQTTDLHRLKRQWRELDKLEPSVPGYAGRLKKLRAAVDKSIAACRRRAGGIPEMITYPPELPVSLRADEIARLLEKHQVLVVAGDTGSGKTTQLPKICLDARLGRRGQIGHTQPRRLAAVSVANRIAEELGDEVGRGVGYQVRFNDRQGPDTYLKVMTDGILLAEIAHDRFLSRYEVLIIDEAHERSLNIDFLLGFLKRLLPKRNDLKVIITSATIDVEKFSTHFNNAPVVKVSGRTYPVEARYRPIEDDEDGGTSLEGQVAAVANVVREIILHPGRNDPHGDILVFLSGERDIREAAQALRKANLPRLEILPLYARLRQSEQARIFQRHRGRRVVLATNVAETSITVPGINYVVDTGLARISRYSLQSKVQRLPVEPISQASANQRMGRCGRLAGGVCIRLYSEEDFNARPLYTDPEIRRTNLASVILRMKYLRLGKPEQFPFLEPPEGKAINEGFKLLAELNALTPDKRLTEAGRRMALLPVDPRFARMLITAAGESCLRELLIISSVLSIQDPREINAGNRAQATDALSRFEHPESDFLTLLNLWIDYERHRQALGQNQLRKYCRSHFLSYMRMREWREVHRQLVLACRQLDLHQNRDEAGYDAVHRSIISGSLNQIACLQEGRQYLNNRNRKFTLFPASVLANKQCKWIVTGELIETSQTFATLAARIQPRWVERMARHLVKREYYEPHWSGKRQEVMAYEKVHLYGLTLIENATVSYGTINPDQAREIFIREALVAGGIATRAAFYKHNRRLLDELAKEEEKIRRPDFFISDREIYRFYDDRLPAEVSSTPTLERWLRGEGDLAGNCLTMSRQALRQDSQKERQTHAYPDQAAVRENRLDIDYVFDPGSSRDGATIEVPVAVLHQLTQADVDWAVPGLLRDKCIALIKSLPKTTRKHFIPVSGYVDAVLPNMSSADGDLTDALLAQIRNTRGLKLARADFDAAELPRYLQSKIRVLDANGRELGFGHNVVQLQEQFALRAQATEPERGGYGHELEREQAVDWVFGELPQEVRLGDDLVLVRYPALVDERNSVALRLFADREAAREVSQAGLMRLYMLKSVQQRNMIRKQFRRLIDRLALVVPAHLANLPEDAVAASYRDAFAIGRAFPRDAEDFIRLLQEGKGMLHNTAVRLERLLEEVLQQAWRIRSRLAELSPELAYLRTDIEAQLEGLLPRDFLLTTPSCWLYEYPRYIQAIQLRLEKAPHMGPRDKPATDELARYWARLREREEAATHRCRDSWAELRWMLEEYRVSLFAQKLGTAIPVSPKRLERGLAQLAN